MSLSPLLSLDGSLVTDMPPHVIGDNQFQILDDISLKPGRFRPRPGYLQITPRVMRDDIIGMKSFIARDSNIHTLVAGTKRDLAKWIGSTYAIGTVAVMGTVNQIITVTPGGTYEAGDTYKVTINGTTYTSTGQANLAAMLTDLAATVNAGSEPVTASGASGTTLVITADTAGVAFTYASSTVDVGIIDITFTIALTAATGLATFAGGADIIAAGSDIAPDDILIVGNTRMTLTALTSTTTADTDYSGADITATTYKIKRTWRFITPHVLPVTTVDVTGGGNDVITANSVNFNDVKVNDFIEVTGTLGAGAYYRKRYKIIGVTQGSPDTLQIEGDFGGVTATGVACTIWSTYTGGDINRWQMENFTVPNYLIMTNGIDNVQRWNPAGVDTAQVVTITPGGTFEGADTYTATINGTNFTDSGSANLAAMLTALAVTVNAGVEPVTADGSSGTTLVLTADGPGSPFTYASSAIDGGGTDDQTFVSVLTTANDSSRALDLEGNPGIAKYLALLNRQLIIANLGGGPAGIRWCGPDDPTDWTYDPASSAGGGIMAENPGEITGLVVANNNLFVFKETAFYIFVPTGSLPSFRRSYYSPSLGNVAPYGAYSAKENVVFLGVDGIYLLDSSGVPKPVGKGLVWDAFSSNFNSALRDYAFWHYFPDSEEAVFFYPDGGADSFPNKALCMNIGASSDGKKPRFSIWNISLSAVVEWNVSGSLTIDTIETEYDWGPPEEIDNMPWASIDRIGSGTEQRATWVASGKKIHLWGAVANDNGTAFMKQAMTKWFGDRERMKLLKHVYLDIPNTGSTNPIVVEIWGRNDWNTSAQLLGQYAVALNTGNLLRIDCLFQRKFFAFIFKSENVNDSWEVWGLQMEWKKTGKRDALWFSNPGDAGGAIVGSGTTQSDIGRGGIGGPGKVVG